VQDGIKTSFTWITDLHLEQYVSNGIGILLVVLLILGSIFGVVSFFHKNDSAPKVASYPVVYSEKGYTYPNSQQKQPTPGLSENIKRMTLFGIIGIVLSLSGFLIGYLTFSKKDSKMDSKKDSS